MSATYDSGAGGWVNNSTGRTYSLAEQRAAEQQAATLLQQIMSGGLPGRDVLPPGPTTTAPRPGQTGYIADPFAGQIAAGTRAPVSVYQPYTATASNGGSVADGGPGAAYGNRAAAPAMTAQDRVNARAQALADARLRNQTQPKTSMADLFGVGGGDWASQWGKANDPRSQISNNFYGGLGLDTDIFNSASGPYGQLQMAAAYTAPARNDRQARMYEADTSKDIAQMKYGTAGKIASQLANLIGGGAGPMTGLQTDYGASAKLNPVDFRRFFVGAK